MTTGQKIVIVLLILSLLAGAITGADYYYQIGYLWGILLLVSWFWSVLVLRGMKVHRTTRTLRAEVGHIYEEHIEIENFSRLPKYLLAVQDFSSLAGLRGSRVFASIAAKSTRSFINRTLLLKRGVFPLGPMVLESSDPFGLFPVKQTFPVDDTLLVYPMMVRLPAFPSPPGILPGGEALRRRTHQITPNAASVRDYAPGDPMNRIHWLSTARRERLISKEFELDPQADVWIFLDAMEELQAALAHDVPKWLSVDSWISKDKIPIPPSIIEYQVCIASSLCQYYLQQGRAVGLVYAEKNIRVMLPDRGGRQLIKLLEVLALIQAEGSLPLRGLLEIESRHIARGSTVVIITPSSCYDVALGVDFLIQRGYRPVVVLINAESFGGVRGSDQLYALVKNLGVPVRKVSCGDNLATALSS